MKIHGFSTGLVQVRPTFLRGSPAFKNTWQFVLANNRDPEWAEPLPILCWLIETNSELILVDTGDRAPTRERGLLRNRLLVEPEEEAGPRLRALGFSPGDLTKIVLTHLHADHVGGLEHFPATPVWISRAEWQPVARWPGSLMRPLTAPVPRRFRPNLIDFRPEPYGACSQTFPLTADGSVLAVPTPGHSPGHLSVIVRQTDHDVLIAGDVSYSQADLQARHLQGPVANPVQLSQTIDTVLRHASHFPTVYLPSHDPESLFRLTQRTPMSLSPNRSAVTQAAFA